MRSRRPLKRVRCGDVPMTPARIGSRLETNASELAGIAQSLAWVQLATSGRVEHRRRWRGPPTSAGRACRLGLGVRSGPAGADPCREKEGGTGQKGQGCKKGED